MARRFHRGRALTAIVCVAVTTGDATTEAAFPGRDGLIAFVSTRDGNNEIYVMAPDGGGQTNLTNSLGDESQPAWAPDGRRIAYTCTAPPRVDQDICVMNADGSARRNLTNNPSAHERSPAWSPTGWTIAFQSNRNKADENDFDIYVMRADGRQVHPIAATSAREEEPAWAGNDTVVYTHSTRFDDHELFTMFADGLSNRLLAPTTLPLNASGPNWSPDGRAVAFTGIVPGELGQIYVLRAAGGPPRRLTSPPGSAIAPAFSPSGTRIAFASDRAAGRSQIYTMRADGSGQKRITFSSASDSDPDWQPSPLVVALAVMTSGRGGRVISSAGGIDCGARCTATLEPQARVVLTARPARGYGFVGWTGACSGRVLRCVVTMDSVKRVGARFAPLLHIAVTRRGRGVVTSRPGGIRCGRRCVLGFVHGTNVTLIATPSSGAVFGGWSGACSGRVRRCTLTASREYSVRAHFLEAAVELGDVRFDGTWRASRIDGDLVASGHARAAAQLDLRLSRAAALVAHSRATVTPGPFDVRLRLPRRLLPGRYLVRLSGTSKGRPIVEHTRRATLFAPSEGVVGRAYVSASKAGPPTARFAGPQRVVWARFEFAALPRLAPVTVTWYGPDGRAAAPAVRKPRLREIDSFARATRGSLRSGLWRCVLRAGGVDVATARTFVG